MPKSGIQSSVCTNAKCASPTPPRSGLKPMSSSRDATHVRSAVPSATQRVASSALRGRNAMISAPTSGRNVMIETIGIELTSTVTLSGPRSRGTSRP
jgi:hypothetical protein